MKSCVTSTPWHFRSMCLEGVTEEFLYVVGVSRPCHGFHTSDGDSVEGLNGRRGEWNKPSRPHLMLHQLCGYTHLRWSHALWQETEGSRAQWAPAKRPCWALREGSPQARPGIGITYLGWHAVPTATRDSAIRTHALTGVPLTSANIRPPPH